MTRTTTPTRSRFVIALIAAITLLAVGIGAWSVYDKVSGATAQADKAAKHAEAATDDAESANAVAQANLDAVKQLVAQVKALGAEPVVDPSTLPTPGPAGATGATGDQGPSGADGAVGPQGPPGPIGATGKRGPRGFTGMDGPIGPTGASGTRGESGAQGPAGPPGPKGETGGQGPAGPSGDRGPAGPAGTAQPGTYECPSGLVLHGFTVTDSGDVQLDCQAPLLP